MKIVIDANILFSAFLSKNSYYRDLLFDDRYTFYSPNFVFLEIFRHKEKILNCTKEPEEEVYGFLEKILRKINFVNEDLAQPLIMKLRTTYAGILMKTIHPL